MAYATANPPRLISQGVGASSGSLWHYTDGDPFATVVGADYFSNGDALGMAVDDVIIITDETTGQTKLGQVSAVTASGASTVTVGEMQGVVVSGTGATATLTVAQSGATVLLDRAAGIVFTLPAPVVGLKYKFVTTVAVTSNAYTVNTDAATTFMAGHVQQIIAASATSEGQVADGSTHVGISSNGTTTGGLIGGVFELECISATVWAINGILVGSGTLATPFTT